MDFVIGNLPPATKEKDIKELVGDYHHPTKIEFLKNEKNHHSPYECLVSLDIKDPIAGTILADHLNNTCFKGSHISFHRLIF